MNLKCYQKKEIRWMVNVELLNEEGTMNEKTLICPFCKRKSKIVYEGAIAFITIKCLNCGNKNILNK